MGVRLRPGPTMDTWGLLLTAFARCSHGCSLAAVVVFRPRPPAPPAAHLLPPVILLYFVIPLTQEFTVGGGTMKY